MARRRRKRVPMLPFGRVLGPPLTIVLFMVTGYLGMTGRLTFLGSMLGSQTSEDGPLINPEKFQFASGAVLPGGTPAARPSDTISIASFNIQQYGTSKSAKAEVMGYLALILREFDVIAVQEIQSKEPEPIEKLLQTLREHSGRNYDVVLSERLGESETHKEQYAFIWDSDRITLDKESTYVVDDSGDFMSREPFVASFSATTTPDGSQPFSFTLINVHTKPDAVERELNVLDDVFQSVRAYEQPEDDVIVLGDLNVEVKDFGDLGTVHGIESVNKEATNTAGNRSIDHIVIDRYSTSEFRKAGVINYERDLQLTREEADRISDHRPVWAVFSISEHAQQGMLASQPGPSIPK